MRSRRRRGGSFRTLGDLEAAGERSVDAGVWGYIQGGAGGERTAQRNEAAFGRWSLHPAVLEGIRSVDLHTSLLGRRVSAPFFLAPTAYQREVHPGGERATAAAASGLGVLGVYSTLSSDSLESIAAAGGAGPRWFQLYLQPELATSIRLVRRAERAGYSAIVVTADTPVLGSRDRQGRSGFGLGRTIPIGNGPDILTPPRGPRWDGGTYSLARSAEVTWKTLDAIRRATSLPLVLKGVLRPESARAAVAHGVSAVIVSNHGGRQLDLAPATLDALPAIVDAVGRDVEVYLDGGVRRGTDVIVALALGAKGVGLGRPVLWALASGGRAGVDRYLRLLGTEVANSLLLLGKASVGAVGRGDLLPVPTTQGVKHRAAPGPPGVTARTGRRERRSGRRRD